MPNGRTWRSGWWLAGWTCGDVPFQARSTIRTRSTPSPPPTTSHLDEMGGPAPRRAAEPWDRDSPHKPWVIEHGGVVYHFYCAVGDRGRVIALATSRDLKAPAPGPRSTGDRSGSSAGKPVTGEGGGEGEDCRRRAWRPAPFLPGCGERAPHRGRSPQPAAMPHGCFEPSYPTRMFVTCLTSGSRPSAKPASTSSSTPCG